MHTDLHPGRGPHNPTSGTPDRTPGSVRRTSTIDMVRPDGDLLGDLHLVGRGRDVLTDSHGRLQILAEAGCHGVVEFVAGRTLRSLDVTPPLREVAALVGHPVSTGFRGRLDAALPHLHEDDGLLFQLLDDLPGTSLISGHAANAGLDRADRHRLLASRPPMFADLCAGFVAGGIFMSGYDRDGVTPVPTGPVAPPLEGAGDRAGWHRAPPLPPTGMRRARRIDLVPGDPVRIDAMFRDTYVLPDGTVTVVHEYTLGGTVDLGRRRLLTCAATARVLPWIECPGAAASAGRLAGMPFDGLRRHVSRHFTGTSTCTHLNDMVRALEGVPGLAGKLLSQE